MGATLNPNLLAPDTTALLNDAAALMTRYRKSNIFPEIALLALFEAKDTPGHSLLQRFAASNNIDLARLARQTRLAVESRRDLPGDLAFITRDNKSAQLSRQMIIAIDDALTYAEQANEVYVRTDHLLAAMSQKRLGTGGILAQYGITPEAMLSLIGGSPAKAASTSAVARQMGGTAVDYVALARAGEKRAVYYREALLAELINMLTQRVNRHVILIGQEGVGKRTLAYSLALLIAEGKGPLGLDRLVQIDETALLDDPVRAIRAGINKAAGGILFIPQIDRFFDQQTRLRQPKVPADLQKAFLNSDPVIIGTAAEATYNEVLAVIPAVHEHSQRLRVPAPDEKETVLILQTLKPQLAADYDITITDDALTMAATLANRYMSGTPLPRSAENLLHRAAALVNMGSQQHVAFKPEKENGFDSTLDAEDVTLAASQMTGIPVSKLGEDERNRYARMVEHLHERIIGQDEAIHAISDAIRRARSGLKDPRRPIGSFIFIGPSGVGKTELAKALAEFLFGDEDALVRMDMSEYHEQHTVSRLFGAPPGYVGYEEGGQLTEAVRRRPYRVILFDEIEKAHPEIWNALLQILDDGRLTDGQGRVVDFRNTVLIMTSNLGTEFVRQGGTLGFLQNSDPEERQAHEKIEKALKSTFRPEFINRIDEIIMFSPLSLEDVNHIVDLQMAEIRQRLQEHDLTVELTPAARAWLAKVGFDQTFGARPLRRALQKYVESPLSISMLSGEFHAGDHVLVDFDADQNKIVFQRGNLLPVEQPSESENVAQ